MEALKISERTCYNERVIGQKTTVNPTKNRIKNRFCAGIFLRVAGLEPARFDPLEPKSSVSTNSTIPAYVKSMGYRSTLQRVIEVPVWELVDLNH